MNHLESFLRLPTHIDTVEELDEFITQPDSQIEELLNTIDGDIMILGIGGKIGSHIGLLAKRAIEQRDLHKRVYGVSRFSNNVIKKDLEEKGIITISCDLLNEQEVRKLPKVKNIIYLVGKKFGTMNDSNGTWAINTLVPKNVCEFFSESRIVVLSTGCVYDLIELKEIGATEDTPTNPLGDYANSAVGREKVFLYYSENYAIPMILLRLNYSIDLRYGVLFDIAKSVYDGKQIDLSMGHVNVLWQGDVIRQTILSLALCSIPAEPLNITGPETVSVRYVAHQFGRLFGKEPVFAGQEQETALLSNSSKATALFGYPTVPLMRMIEWVANWVKIGGETLNKATHFETRNGKY